MAALHRNGFLQSLILHVAGLLALSLTVIPPLAPGREVRLDVAFAAAPAALCPDQAEAVLALADGRGAR